MGRPSNGYWLDGKRIPSVTTITSNVKVGGIEPLLSWANRMGQEGKHHREEANKAADAGTCAHDMIEAYVKGYEFDPEPYTYEALDTAKPCFDAFKEWANQTQLELIESEVSLISERYGYGGTFDALAVNGRLILGDWKTASGVYPDNLLQLAAYKQLWEENYPDRPIEGGLYILRISKQREPEDPVSFAHHWWSNLDQAWECFEHMLEVHRLAKRVKALC
jgi:hypothetical protein